MTKEEKTCFFDQIDTSVGILYLHFNVSALTAITLKKPNYLPHSRNSISAKAIQELMEYFIRKRKTFTTEIFFEIGTDFQKLLWNFLKKIPYGETRTYKWLAEKAMHPKAYRAVGRALGQNPIPIMVPCHRIIRSDNELGGYSHGLMMKYFLLKLEGKF